MPDERRDMVGWPRHGNTQEDMWKSSEPRKMVRMAAQEAEWAWVAGTTPKPSDVKGAGKGRINNENNRWR